MIGLLPRCHFMKGSEKILYYSGINVGYSKKYILKSKKMVDCLLPA